MSFERELSILDDIEDEVSRVGRKIGVNIDRRLVNETPRDTGSAKSSWLVSIGQPNNSVVNTEEGAAIPAALEQGSRTASRYESGDTMYIQNNQPYINRLNEGSSEQAPRHFVDQIIMEEVNRAD